MTGGLGGYWPQMSQAAKNSKGGVPLIYNPAARSQRARKFTDDLVGLSPAPRLFTTSGPGDGRRLAARCAREGEKVVAAAGGDGTLNEVVAGFLDAAREGHAIPALGVLPLGTMNVFALEMDLPGDDFENGWKIVTSGREREVDLWLANGHPMIQLGGAGLDARVVAETTASLKNRLGPMSYVINALRILGEPAPKLAVDVDDNSFRGALVLFGNGERYAGPARVFPGADPGDGLLDVLVLHQQGPVDLVGFLGALAAGKLERFPGITLTKGRRVRVRTAADSPGQGGSGTLPFEIDGEAVGELPLEIEHSGHRLRVRVGA